MWIAKSKPSLKKPHNVGHVLLGFPSVCKYFPMHTPAPELSFSRLHITMKSIVKNSLFLFSVYYQMFFLLLWVVQEGEGSREFGKLISGIPLLHLPSQRNILFWMECQVKPKQKLPCCFEKTTNISLMTPSILLMHMHESTSVSRLKAHPLNRPMGSIVTHTSSLSHQPRLLQSQSRRIWSHWVRPWPVSSCMDICRPLWLYY